MTIKCATPPKLKKEGHFYGEPWTSRHRSRYLSSTSSCQSRPSAISLHTRRRGVSAYIQSHRSSAQDASKSGRSEQRQFSSFPSPPPFPARIRHRPGCVGRDRATVLVSPLCNPSQRFIRVASPFSLCIRIFGRPFGQHGHGLGRCAMRAGPLRMPIATPDSAVALEGSTRSPPQLACARACNARDAQSQPEQPEAAPRYQRPSQFWALRIWRRICRPAGQETLFPPPFIPGPAIHPHVHPCTLSE